MCTICTNSSWLMVIYTRYQSQYPCGGIVALMKREIKTLVELGLFCIAHFRSGTFYSNKSCV